MKYQIGESQSFNITRNTIPLSSHFLEGGKMFKSIEFKRWATINDADLKGRKACINTSGTYPLPWAIYLEVPEGWLKVCENGSYGAALREFNRLGLVP